MASCDTTLRLMRCLSTANQSTFAKFPSLLYSLFEAEAAFFKATTGINDDEELKAHIPMAQENAYKDPF